MFSISELPDRPSSRCVVSLAFLLALSASGSHAVLGVRFSNCLSSGVYQIARYISDDLGITQRV